MAFAFLHLFVSLGFSASALGAVMMGFDGGETASPVVLAFLMGAAMLLRWPLALLAGSNMSGAAFMALALANGLLWGVAALWVYEIVTRRWMQRHGRVRGT